MMYTSRGPAALLLFWVWHGPPPPFSRPTSLLYAELSASTASGRSDRGAQPPGWPDWRSSGRSGGTGSQSGWSLPGGAESWRVRRAAGARMSGGDGGDACVRAFGARWGEGRGEGVGFGATPGSMQQLQQRRERPSTLAWASRKPGANCCHMQTHAVDGGPVVLDQIQAQRAVRVDVRVELRHKQATGSAVGKRLTPWALGGDRAHDPPRRLPTASRAPPAHYQAHHFAREAHAGRLVWVLLSEHQAHRVDATLPRRVVRAKNGGPPDVDVLITQRARAHALRRLLLHCLEV